MDPLERLEMFYDRMNSENPENELPDEDYIGENDYEDDFDV